MSQDTAPVSPSSRASRSYSIGKLSKASGVNIETIRYYERIGLLEAPPRAANGYRQYKPRHLAELGFIRRGRQLGFSLDDIRELLALDQGESPCQDAQRIAREHIQALTQKIADLQRLHDALSQIEGQCQPKQHSRCPLIAALHHSE